MSRKVLLIGLDGATYTLLDPLIEAGVMPFLASFIAEGVRADLRTIIPPLTPPAWTSLLTGRTPGHHGIFDFFQLESPGSKRIRLATSKDVLTPTIAEMVNDAGLQATVLNFPAHFPPPPIDGTVVAGWMPWRQLRLGCHPETIFDELKQLPDFNARELAMDMAQEASATEGSDDAGNREWAELHARREEHWRDVVCHLMQAHPTAFTALLLDGPDKVQHLCWRFLDPALAHSLTPEEEEVRASCMNFYQRLDAVLADIVAAAGEETTVVLASDHGFGATTEVLHINSWLAEAGYLTWATDKAQDAASDGILGMRQLSRHTEWIDWKRTKAFAATPTGNGIHIVIAEENDGHGVPRQEYEQFRAELKSKLLAYRAPAKGDEGDQVITEVWTREEIFPGTAAGYGPDLTLTLRDGGLVSILPSAEVLQPRPQPAGTHRPLGIFIARGPGIRKGIRAKELSLLDVAPLLLYGLGLPIPSDLEGRVPLEIFEVVYRAKNRVTTTAAAADNKRASTQLETEAPPENADLPEDATYDDDGEATIMARLRSLGYIQ